MIDASPSDAERQRQRDLDAIREETIQVLARTIWGEARGEAPQGRIAVANVVINRVKRGGWWGRTVASVCLKPDQFSCWRHDDPNRQKLLSVTPSDHVFAECLHIARMAVDGELEDITGGATHYLVHSITDRVKWDDNMTPTVRIGAHQFFVEA